MSTITESKVKTRAELRRKLNQKRLRRCAAYCAVMVGVGASFAASHLYYSKTLLDLKKSNEKLSSTVADMHTKDEASNNRIFELENKLAIYEEPIEYIVTEPAYYNVPLSKELQHYTYNLCVDYSIPEYYDLILAIMWQESDFNPDEISSTDDYGIMQINACNHSWLREKLDIVDIMDEHQNIRAGVHIFATLLHKYDNVHKALMAYNYGEGGAKNCWKGGTYTSAYSRDVVSKRELVKTNKYGTA